MCVEAGICPELRIVLINQVVVFDALCMPFLYFGIEVVVAYQPGK